MWTFWNGGWHEGPVNLAGPHTHAFWLGSSVFDGARIYDGVAPDLDRHCARVNESARKLGLAPTKAADEIIGLALEGAKRFGPGAAIYVKPMYWAEGAAAFSTVAPGADSTAFCLHLFEAAMPAGAGYSVTLSPFRRPTMETMPTDVKTGSLYPNNARAIREAKERGFDNALVCDMLGNVAETATSNIFMARGGEVFTPAANGTFLNGITRQRVIALLRGAGVNVHETTLRYADFLAADEIFSSGNYAKVQPIVKIDSRDLQPGPLYRKARDLYADFARG
jgi:branched-chain amino acid aminotransferase